MKIKVCLYLCILGISVGCSRVIESSASADVVKAWQGKIMYLPDEIIDFKTFL